MEKDLPDPQTIACARQIMDVPMDFPGNEDGFYNEAPHYIGWFALGHVAVLLYLALHWLTIMTPMERALAAIVVAVLGMTLTWMIRGKVRTAVAMAEIVVPSEVGAKALD